MFISRILKTFVMTLLVCLCFPLMAPGCGSEVDPQPAPHVPNRLKILISATLSRRFGGPIDQIGIIGLKGAVIGRGFLVIRTPTGLQTVAKTGSDGAFAAVISGAAGDGISIGFRETIDGSESEPLGITIPLFALDAGASAVNETRAPTVPNSQNADLLNAGFVSPSLSVALPDTQGRVRLTGKSFVSGDIATIGNTRTSVVTEVIVNEQGAIDAFIDAATGDSLLVIIRNPVSNLNSQVATLFVSAP